MDHLLPLVLNERTIRFWINIKTQKNCHNLKVVAISIKKMQIKLGKYQHYKGKHYEVIGVAKHSETLEELVVYKALYQKEGENLWVRPLKMFTETIILEGKKAPRFEYLGV